LDITYQNQLKKGLNNIKELSQERTVSTVFRKACVRLLMKFTTITGRNWIQSIFKWYPLFSCEYCTKHWNKTISYAFFIYSV